MHWIVAEQNQVFAWKDNERRKFKEEYFLAIEIPMVVHIVMNIEWDYNYYQPWSDNEWLVDEMMAMLNEDIIMQ